MTLCTCCGDTHPPEKTVCPRTGQPVGSGPCGTRIDRYEVERLLGDGGMGAVYRARHVMLNQQVALKLLHAEFSRRGDMLERFLREARAAATIGNPHIIRVHDCGVTPEGRPFLVMELLEGDGLEAILKRERRLSPQRTVALGVQVLDGLGAAHAAGIIHRDMKPANVFVRRTPDPAQPEFVTVLDFGISKMAEPDGSASNLTQTGAVMGTPVYMAPEQIMRPKEIDPRVDLYAAGVMLYEMLAGKLPYEGANTAELIVKACTSPPIPLRESAPDLPQPLIDVIDRALAREPGDRWATAGDFADALRRSLGGAHSLPTSPQGSGEPQRGAPPQHAAPPQAPAWPANAAPAQPPSSPSMVYAPMGAAASTASSPSHWGAMPSMHGGMSAPANFAPPAASTGGVGRTLWIVGGTIVGLVSVCCVAAIVVAAFSKEDAPQRPAQPQMTPMPATQQQLAPSAGAPHPGAPMLGQMTPQAPQADPDEAVHVDEPRVLGLLSADGVSDALERATPAMDRCRVATPQVVTVLAIVQPDGRVAIARPADSNAGDAQVAQCVGNRFASTRVESGGQSGIVTFTAHLARR